LKKSPSSRIRNAVRQYRDGFTLVEVMISMMLICFFMATVYGVVTIITRSAWVVTTRSEAVSLAWSRLERARNTDFANLDELQETSPGSILDTEGRTVQEGDFRRVTTVTDITSTGLPSKRVRVQVWTRNHLTQDFDTEPETLESIFTDIPRVVEVQE
jgi:prepilin-type N-terminal cleavage/methylation domain-containing protein